MSLAVGFFNNMAGIGIVNIFSTTIFENVHKGQAVRTLSIKQENYYIGLSGLVGAVLSLWTIKYLSRRTIFIGGHLLMAVLLLMVAHFIDAKQPELVLINLCAFIIVYQMTQGSAFWIYVAEIVSSDSVMGICLFCQMLMLNAQSMTTIYLMSSSVGVNGLFYILGAFNIVAFFVFTMFLKETKGL
jgi:hypothetical protein